MPEEINRILTDRISDILFCPTITAVNNLLSEGYGNLRCLIEQCGDVMQDAAHYYSSKSVKPSDMVPSKYVLCTIHRAENTDNSERLLSIIGALEDISMQYCKVVIPLHPRTKSKLNNIGYNFSTTPICFIEPVGYLEMVYLQKNCELIMTDSGGVQKEAFFFNKYCITLRDETEWVELVENGYNIISGSNRQTIIDNYLKIVGRDKENFTNKLYGDGTAGEKIINIIRLYN